METSRNSTQIVKSSMWEGRAHRHRLGPDQLGSSSVEKDLEMWADVSAGHERVSSMSWQQKQLTVPCALLTKVVFTDRGK